jgi:pilus assembly protein Flp/PilA
MSRSAPLETVNRQHASLGFQSHKGETMQGVRTAVRRFIRNDEAIAVTEYGLLVALVAVLLIGVVTIFGSSIKSWFEARTSTITTV